MLFERGNSSLALTPPVVSPQAASLPMSIIIVGVGPAEFDGKSVCVRTYMCELVSLELPSLIF